MSGAAPDGGRPRVVLGVAGGIAAYKALEVLRRLTETGHDVRVVPTPAALRFVGETTFAALSGHPVHTDVWADADEVAHVRIGREADLVLIVPATADLMARAAAGRADDLLTGTLLTARCPVVYAPAMHTEMWEHPATRANVATLRERGAVVIEPAVGRLTGPDSGAGRLPEPVEIAAVARAVLALGPRAASPDLGGRHVVVSAGGTREHLDPVRFLGNSSSGRQGYALARAAVARGARVTLVAANVALPDPAGAGVVRVVSALDLREAVHAAAADADVVVMTAAVADFRPAKRVDHKIKKEAGVPAPVELEANPDVLAELVATRATRPPGQVLVGFAAETGGPDGDVLSLGRAKLARKPADLLVVNEVGAGLGFEVDHNAAVVLGSDGSTTTIERTTKDLLAHRVLDLVAARLRRDISPV
ncbi:bifunctional phosphopantothenoylcysteine decarboxylase/phosphopantothenate--cysteine ligase CoaBC [Frankia sp. AgB1.9]|uniref:bifunctional phosphopantothenoylcysteine decarboxylase/phosphopantothenate--cysteine ligase CoaBC n=1 Tax=unclassified Frankia TaxID=2632575 RepID=UPI0019313C55|nr:MULTISPECIES: bifunctional phosphopantothenoylcysteine decarboxylase/phosphopantothenate--cysteine ligase CoaBC [unclassified Frankia]MBL7493781.1 bifunctional phosphopantothenoylcysteine decarboxylase/phosphopantothenate--cysteine ligase CoaBC [Frankia sp. AgW1.1]MBL7549095.1 bifunctional phosphopantothenoylcysteine decarboxylase/phosphopantothenate--cysteine ligase CoaBC [Frankia sp. AgB1.9]MBL7619734.1 bifunctional phosphopantothenoylcysteine decarboxylase/phosphopantothenate--cysteine lig